MMSNFDIEMLDAIDPPRVHCTKCLALVKWPEDSFWLDPSAASNSAVYTACPLCRQGDNDHLHPICPVCGVHYLPAQKRTKYDLYYFLLGQHPSPWDYTVRDEEELVAFLHHCRKLGGLAARLRQEPTTPMPIFLRALALAKSFVHCTSYGPLPDPILDTLVSVAQRIPVRGIVANVDPVRAGILQDLSANLGNLTLKPDLSRPYLGDALYQQLFIIDGLLAFRGSTNLAGAGMNSTIGNEPVLNIVSESDAVFALHNRYFAPMWSRLSTYGDSIIMP